MSELSPREGPAAAGPTGLLARLKRLIDLGGAAAALILLAPLLLVLALLIVLDSGWPPLFAQQRIGRSGRPFTLYKFRTMVVGAENKGAGLYFEKQDPRITRVGHFLRRYSLDELPQVWNVLLGHESLVGPRAMVPSLAAKLDAQQNLRHRVRPGVTGWAQINGRNTLTWSTRVDLDNWYIDHWSLALDLQILLRTLPAALAGEGIRLDQSQSDVDDLG